MVKERIVTAACALLLLGSAAYATDPENTAKNARDTGNSGTLTAFDQGGSEADRKTTAEIRKAIVGDDSLSVNAHNVKIITLDGMVTLRGPVNSNAEKATVEKLAKNVAGATNVDNQLDVDPD
jgi:osmotically-inducible protein OsmY